MNMKGIQLFSMINKKMTYVGQRQDVLAQNVAQADTPDYVPRDLVPLDFRETLRQQFVRLAPAQASEHHLKGTLPLNPKFRSPEVDRAYETAPDGNKVILEEQLMNIQDNQIQHHAATNIYRKYGRMFKTALARGSGG